jgi:flagellar biosynthesis protein FlhG
MLNATHYDVLGLAPTATAEQVEQAYQFFAGMYGEESVATYSLLDPDELRVARARIKEAYEVLSDAERRVQYDSDLASGPVEVPVVVEKPARPAPAAAPPLPAAPRRILPEPVTGASLRKAREELGIPLQHIAGATKIGVRFLEYIEADRHNDLPALVYLRGFVQEYARFLGLEPRRTAESYLRRIATD